MPAPTKVPIIFVITLLLFSAITNAQCVVNASPSQTVCAGNTVTLTGTPVGGTWTSIPLNPTGATLGATSNGQATVTFTSLANGNYGFTYTTATCSEVITITVNPKPTATFTYTTAGQCANLPFSFSASPALPGYTYSWDFGSGATSMLQNPSHVFINAIGPPGTQGLPVQLTVTNSFGCSGNANDNVQVRNMPDASIGNPDPLNVQLSSYNGVPTFRRCGSTLSYNFSFGNSSATTSTHVKDSIVWGYGLPTETILLPWTNQTLNHTYPVGLKQLTRYVTDNFGCIGTKTYNIYIGSNPAGGPTNPGATVACTGQSLIFPFSPQSFTNPPGTEYLLWVVDEAGLPVSDTTYYFQETLPPFHSQLFTKSSCYNGNSTFTLKYRVRNPCALPPLQGNFDAIQISQSPKAGFKLEPNDTVICVNKVVKFIDTSLNKAIVFGECRKGKSIWSISPNTGWAPIGSPEFGNENGSSNPDSWAAGDSIININFISPGLYQIKLKTGNGICGTLDSVTKTICVNPIPTATFTLSDNTIRCIPDTVTAFGVTNQATCGNNQFKWRVEYNPYDDCLPNTRGDTLINGTTLQSQNPQFVFRTPGRYKIILETLAPGTNQTCKSDTISKTVIVKGKPNVLLTANSPFCISDSLTPVLTNRCDTASATVLWTYTGANISSHLGSVSPALYYAAPGTYNIAVSVTNSCGSTDTSVNIQVVAPTKPSAGPDTTICSGDTISIGVGPAVNGTTYLWGPATGISNVNLPVTNIALTYHGPNDDVTYQYVLTSSVSSSPGCRAFDTVFIKVKKSPELVKSTPTAMCSGSLIRDTLIVSGATSYTWSPMQDIVLNASNDTAIVSPTVNTIYYVTGFFDNGCSTKDSFVVVIGAKPNIGNDTAITRCSGQPVNLNPLYNTSGLTASWTLNGAPVANTANITIAGAYQLIVKNSTGCADTALATITFSPKPGLGNDSSIIICSGTTFNLATLFDTTGLNVVWYFNNQVVSNPGSINTSGTYTAIAANGSICADTLSVTLSISPKPNLGPNRDTTVCAGQPINLNDFYDTIGYASHNWTLNTSVVSNPAVAVTSGNYQLIVLTSQGCSDTANVMLLNKPKPTLGPDQNIPICSGQSVNLNTVFNISNLIASWSLGGNPVSRPDSVTTTGAYQLIVFNNDGCSDTAFANIIVSTQPNLNPPVQTVSSCSGAPVNLTVLYNTTGFNTYWFLNGNPVNNPFSVTAPGTYMLVAESNPGGSCKDTTLVTLIFNPNYDLGPDTSLYICPGEIANLTGLYNTTGVNPQWTFNGLAVSNPSSVSQAGIYKLKVTNNYGCNDSAYVTIVYKLKPNLGSDTMLMACQGTPINLNNLYNTFGLSATWTLFGGNVVNPSAVTATGTYVLVATNNQTSCTDTANAMIFFNIKPNLGPDTTVVRCLGDTVDVSNIFGTTNYFSYWTPSTPTAVTNFSVFTYIVVDLISGCADSANVTVLFRAKPNLGNDVLIDTNCIGTYLNLLTYFNLPPNINQVWTNGGTVVVRPDSVLVTPNTTYQLVANNGGCYDTAFLSLGQVFPKPILGSKEVKKCFPDSLLLNTLYPGTFSTVIWSTIGGTVLTPPYITDTSGIYQILATNSYGCRDSAIVDFVLHPPINAFAGNDTSVVKGSFFQLHGTGGNNYLWKPAQPLNSPFIATPTASVFNDTYFYLRVRDSANLNCSDLDTVFVRVFDEEGIYVPNAFTPGIDPNRIFIPFYIGIKELKLFRIYNRWGMMLFETKHMAKGWDGTYKGQAQELGNYIWVLQAIDKKNQPVELKGNVALLR